jgi:putative oxidoreductase
LHFQSFSFSADAHSRLFFEVIDLVRIDRVMDVVVNHKLNSLSCVAGFPLRSSIYDASGMLRSENVDQARKSLLRDCYSIALCWMRTLLTGLSEWQWLGALIARLAVGLLFFLSGRGKLFVPERREQMRESLVAAGIPFASINAIFVSTVEFVFGLLLILGALTPLACIMLGGVMVVAIATSAIKNIKTPPLLGWLSEFLYLPEVLYLVILFWLFLSSPGWLSVDRFVFEAR